jgi:hypothetical protein
MRIPIKALKALKALANQLEQDLVIVCGWDGKASHTTTWGRSTEQAGTAADLGNKMKDGLGWPQYPHAQPSRVRRLKTRIEELEGALAKERGTQDMP